MSDTAAQRRLATVCSATVTVLTADGAAATLVAATGPTLVHATDETAGRLEREQQTCGEGPSLSAFQLQAPVVVDDLRGTEAQLDWPMLADALHGMDVGRFVALPVGLGGIRLGVLSIYSHRPGALYDGQLPAALLAADAAALAMLDAEGESAGAVPLSELGPVLDYRIHQATGMVMGQTGLDARDAFARLRSKAFTEDIPLQRLASDVIARRVRFNSEMP
ncbi:MAG: hypothetical protein QOJ79_565 [Actinomycetota bacterium]|jgi:hypothetical protein|nr:hypothetical protein [Actinomycetota bacterium]